MGHMGLRTGLRALLLCGAGLCGAGLCAAASAQAAPISLYAAGSLSGALGQVAQNYTAATGIAVTTTFGASGTLRAQIEAGARPDVFASADTASPLRLQSEGLAGPVTDFTSNRVVAVVAPGYAVSTGTLVATLLDPSIALGTSTPVADPLGDYTEQLFGQIDAQNPGAKAILDDKAERLIAGPNSPPVPAGANSLVYFLDTTRDVDVFLTYYSSAVAALALDPALREVELPANLAVSAAYGLTTITGADPGAQGLANYILSPAGQQVLAQYGFGTTATSVPEPAGAAVLGAGLLGLAGAVRRRTRRDPSGH